MSNNKIITLVANAVEANQHLLVALNEYLSETNVAETATKAPAKKAPVKKAVEEEVEEAPTKKAPAKKAPAKKAPVKKAVEVEEDEEDEEGETELPSDFATMKLPQLKAFAKENGVHIPKDTKIAVVRELILEGLGLAEEDEEEEEEEEEAEMSENTFTYLNDEEEEVTVDLEDLDVKGLKALAKEFDVKVPVKLKTKSSIIEFLMEAFDAEEDEEEEEADDVEADEDFEEEENPEVLYGLDELSTEELADILEEAGLKATGKRPQLVARIVKGIEDGTIETADEEEGE